MCTAPSVYFQIPAEALVAYQALGSLLELHAALGSISFILTWAGMIYFLVFSSASTIATAGSVPMIRLRSRLRASGFQMGLQAIAMNFAR